MSEIIANFGAVEQTDVISGFASEGSGDGGRVDFSRAARLNRGGSTCEAWEATVQRRRVFIKRLRAEYRGNPLYRAAFDKEFDLGVSLSHPSLPRYVAFHGDYIVMDFLEGDTLAQLFDRHDARLRDRRFVRSLFSQLVDVIDYLHHRHVVHCDVKADNVIVSPYADRPVTLIDLDKAYTSWLDSSAGNPEKYGCPECADGSIDWMGLAHLADRAGMGAFARACRRENVSADDLRALLTHGPRRRWPWLAAAAMMVAAATFLLLRRSPEPVAGPAPIVAAAVPDTTAASVDTVATSVTPLVQPAQRPGPSTDTQSTDAPEAGIAASPGAHRENRDKAAIRKMDEIVLRHYGPLYRRHSYLRSLMADSAVTARMLTIAYKAYADKQMAAQDSIMAGVMDLYHLSNCLEAQPILVSSREWGRFMKADWELSKLMGDTIRSRQANQ